MRKLILASAVAAIAMPIAAAPASAQGYNERQERRECARELRQSDTRDDGELAADITRWFSRWMRHGLISRVEAAEDIPARQSPTMLQGEPVCSP